MNTSRSSESSYSAHESLGSLQPYAIDFNFEAHQLPGQYPPNLSSYHVPTGYPSGTLPTQHAVAHRPAGISTTQDEPPWHQPLPECPLIRDRPNPVGILTQPQGTPVSHAEWAVRTIQSGPTSGSNDRQERPQSHRHRRLTPRGPVRQDTYKLTRRRAEFEGSDVIRFVVNGEEGIRLSDALEGNWEGFEGRDDRSLFEGNRLQIMIRLQFVGCSPWQSKIPITDFTKKRRPITRMRLAAQVAKSMQKFIKREKSNGPDGGDQRCNWGDMSLENVYLNRMVRVSAASWQPEICAELPSVPSQAASSLP